MTIGSIARSQPRSLVVFFALAFGISWAVWIPAALASYGLLSVQVDPFVSNLLGTFGPFVAAVVTTACYEGRTGLGALFKRLLIWRVGIQWYLFVLFWPATLSLAKTTLAILAGSAAPDFAHPPFVQLYSLPPGLAKANPLLFLPFVLVWQTLLGSSMGEEIGWRGYALPHLQSRHSSLRASLLLGACWGIWHLPEWLTNGFPLPATFVGWSLLGLMANTVLFTWVFNNTKGSLLLALLFHTSIAITGLFLATVETHPLIEVALSWGVAMLVVAAYGPKQLSRVASGTSIPAKTHPLL